MGQTVSIFIRTYRADRDWLRYAMRSMRKFAIGFKEIVVAMPEEDRIHFSDEDLEGARVVLLPASPMRGYIDQQWSKVTADLHVDADYILFTDSDTIATEPFMPHTFFSGLQPIQLFRQWEDCGAATIFREPVEQAVGHARFEHMACLPLVYHRSTLALLRDTIQAKHGRPAFDYFVTHQDESLSEFNMLGAVAFHNQRAQYSWRIANPVSDGYPRVFRQHWSWDGVEKHRDCLERICA